MSECSSIMNEMKKVFGEAFCKNCTKLNFLTCYRCNTNFCSFACMILDAHEHAPGANEFSEAEKKTAYLKNHKMKRVEETLAFKVMKDKLPEHVKKGIRISVQDRLKKALEKTVTNHDDVKQIAEETMDSKTIEKVPDQTIDIVKKNIDTKSDLVFEDDLLEKIKSQINLETEEEIRQIWKYYIEARKVELASFKSE